MIRIDDLTIRFGSTVALRHFHGRFSPGTITALVGGDGAGKTTLLRRLAVPRSNAQRCVTNHDALEVGYQPARSGVWQNLSVAENLEFACQTYGVPPGRRAARIAALLAIAGLEGAEDRLGRQLSGGMRQKLGVIMAMIHRPELLLLDEPTTGVDPQSRAQLWALIARAAQEEATVVLATTYLDEAKQADQVVVLDGGRTIARGTPAEVIQQTPGQIWQQPVNGDGNVHLADPTRWQRGHTAFQWTASPNAPVPAGMTVAPLDLELSTIAAMLARAQTATHDDEDALWDWTALALPEYTPAVPLIDAQGVTHHFGAVHALQGVDLQVNAGEIVGLIGGNGAGKSTLIRVILGLIPPTGGQVRLFDQAPNHEARKRIGYVPQSLGLYPTLTPAENLTFTSQTFHHAVSSQVMGLAGSVGTGLTGQLPLGAQRNLAVICALSHTPRLLILDEPTSGMDPLSRARLWKIIRRAANRGMGILITTHYQQEAIQCDRLIHLDRGRVVVEEAPTTTQIPLK